MVCSHSPEAQISINQIQVIVIERHENDVNDLRAQILLSHASTTCDCPVIIIYSSFICARKPLPRDDQPHGC